MDNPFAKRATEHVREDEAFLSLVTPEPVIRFLTTPGGEGQLYDRLVVIRGTPGSGKTTMAKLFEYPLLTTLLRHSDLPAQRALAAALSDAGAIEEGMPRIAGCRLALETDYRDIWQFPYSETLRIGLTHALIQTRAVLAWIRNLRQGGVALDAITVVPRGDAHAASQEIGGTKGREVLERAKETEEALYRIAAALVPPVVDHLPAAATGAYRPLDAIRYFEIEQNGSSPRRLIPLLILDDAHVLHPSQLASIQHWLARRELRVGRWILTRLDVLTPKEVLARTEFGASEVGDLPGLTARRDVLNITLQGGLETRRGERLAFRKMAKDMADRYLRQMPIFARRNILSLANFLRTDTPPMAPGKLDALKERVNDYQEKLQISDSRRRSLEAEVRRYAARAKTRELTDDVQLAMLSILFHRYANRVPQSELFTVEQDPAPSRKIKAESGVAEAAQVQLMHSDEIPHYYGIDALCDASSENAEQFLSLASALVELAATQLVRSRRASLTALQQHKLLRSHAGKILREWNFPHCHEVRRLADGMAERCVRKTLEPNAPLSHGASAWGIPQEDFTAVVERYPELARVLQYAVAYNALILVPEYGCQGREWCLLELGGAVLLHHGLTLHRGGFIKSDLDQLAQLIR